MIAQFPGTPLCGAPHGAADAGCVDIFVIIYVAVQNIPLLGEILLVLPQAPSMVAPL